MIALRTGADTDVLAAVCTAYQIDPRHLPEIHATLHLADLPTALRTARPYRQEPLPCSS